MSILVVCEMQTSRNFDNNLIYKFRSLLEENGKLEDINEEKNVNSYCTEDGKLGKACIENARTAFYNLKTLFLPLLGVTQERFEEMLETLPKELEDNKSYFDIARVYGRKKENV
ncbi:3705_t:CDS:2 [Acaulospora morrowiae]|uniref:3705_t:CDS:1 n=1 Tax=Acaulospora morrowiae TaxID=94023 RepID=A0A9N9F381_9GLOM|nr:3705_t:CDS:2 [Acaulospora morrowiae]